MPTVPDAKPVAPLTPRHPHLEEILSNRELEILALLAQRLRDKEIADRIFEPFVTTKQGNLGMGLAVCRRIIENQGGHLTIENQTKGGACFRAWLPACTL